MWFYLEILNAQICFGNKVFCLTDKVVSFNFVCVVVVVILDKYVLAKIRGVLCLPV